MLVEMADSFHGLGVSPGVTMGPAHLLTMAKEEYHSDLAPAEERNALAQAIKLSVLQLQRIAQKLRHEQQEPEAGIIDAQILMVQDPSLLDAVESRIDAGEPAAHALRHEGERLKAMLESLGDEYMAARAADVQDVVMRITRNLRPDAETQSHYEPSVLVAHDLTPSETASLDRSLVIGIATDTGSRTSHTAILAQALGIPAVVGLGDISTRIVSGQQIALDGEEGVVIVDPTSDQHREFEQRRHAWTTRHARLSHLRAKPAETRDNRRLILAANIGSPDDLTSAVESGAEGVGLFRSEFLFAGRDRMPDEDEQAEAYRSVLEAMGENLVVVRTLDVGGDKPLPYLPAHDEANPFLGERGIRYTFANLDVFRTQLRALMRASRYGRLGIMFPMIGDVHQIREACALVEQTRGEVGGTAEIGIMVEIPSAALIAGSLAKEVSFFSVGSNDLVQYTLAVDRVNERVATLYQPLHPAVLRLLAMTADAAHDHGRWAGVCGEMGGDLMALPLLVGLGYDELSMTAGRIPAAKELIRSLDYGTCQGVARRALECSTAEQVADLVRTSNL
ncbi:MAG: phosphoenolpyruvate--protein phosphotransferase [Chloroflexota bacterium]